MKRIAIISLLILSLILALGCQSIIKKRKDITEDSKADRIRFIDTHQHFNARQAARGDLEGLPEIILEYMDSEGIAQMLIMPQPQAYQAGRDVYYDFPAIAETINKYPDRFKLVAGGGALNPLIQQAVKEGRVTPQMRQEFRDKAKEIADAGAVGFGEMTALHFSLLEGHPFEEAPPDHELFLLLADLASQYQIPIDLHMDAVAEDMSTPQELLQYNNPSTINENISGLERLLKHNRKAMIVWQHIGWDNTGDMTVKLLRRLLEENSNLYLSFKFRGENPKAKGKENLPLEDGELKGEWLKLIEDFPDRFMLGTDNHFSSEEQDPNNYNSTRWILNELPTDLARKVGYENAAEVYGLEIDADDMEGEESFQPSKQPSKGSPQPKRRKRKRR